MREYSERIHREGNSCPPTLGEEPCKGTLVYLGVSESPGSLVSAYIVHHECNECERKFANAADTPDGRVELVES